MLEENISYDVFPQFSSKVASTFNPSRAISNLQAEMIKNGDKRGNEGRNKKDKQSLGKTRIINGPIIKLTFFSIISS